MNFIEAINITEFKHYSQKKIKAYLTRLEGNFFQIAIPKIVPDFDNTGIATSYYSGAYAGQLLKDVSSSFAYYVPPPTSESDFIFELETFDLLKLAFVLQLLVHVFVAPDGDNFDEADFAINALQYVLDCFDGKRKSDCWGLVGIAIKYIHKDP